MRFFTITYALALAFTASAAPQYSTGAEPAYPSSGLTTIADATKTCGSNTSLNCCNEADLSGPSASYASGILSGLLNGVLGSDGLGLFKGCSKLDVTVIGASDLLNKQCSATAACCQDNPQNQAGLVNLGIPCLAISGLA